MEWKINLWIEDSKQKTRSQQEKGSCWYSSIYAVLIIAYTMQFSVFLSLIKKKPIKYIKFMYVLKRDFLCIS